MTTTLMSKTKKTTTKRPPSGVGSREWIAENRPDEWRWYQDECQRRAAHKLTQGLPDLAACASDASWFYALGDWSVLPKIPVEKDGSPTFTEAAGDMGRVLATQWLARLIKVGVSVYVSTMESPSSRADVSDSEFAAATGCKAACNADALTSLVWASLEHSLSDQTRSQIEDDIAAWEVRLLEARSDPGAQIRRLGAAIGELEERICIARTLTLGVRWAAREEFAANFYTENQTLLDRSGKKTTK